ncbi:MAG: hypothetical protein QXR26_04960 [Candidatus Caldarchaeum sp.]
MSGEEPTIHNVNLESVRPQAVFEIDFSQPLDAVFDWVKNNLQPKPPILHLAVKTETHETRNISEIVDRLRRLGCLEIRYRRIPPEKPPIDVTHFDLTRFNIEELIRVSASQTGLSTEETELAIQLYRMFRTSGEESVKEYVVKNILETRSP